MASIHEQSGHWFCAFSIFDAETGENKRVFRSTKVRDEKVAEVICNVWGKAAARAREHGLNKTEVDKLTNRAVEDIVEASKRSRAKCPKIGAPYALKIVERGIKDIYDKINPKPLEKRTIREWCNEWLEKQSIRTEDSTHARYERIIERFVDFLGKDKSERDLRSLEDDDIEGFHIREAKELAASTADLGLKVLRMCFGAAVQKRLLSANPAENVAVIGGKSESTRRPFTLDEIKRILRACDDDQEWRGLVLFGLYVGQRLGDLARLTWRAVDLNSGEIAFTARKTGKRIVLPLVQPLIDYLSELPASDDPNAFIFRRAASAKRTSTLSNQFRELLTSAGLVTPRTHQSTGRGRSATRETSEISFHSLRHSAVTMLKAAGVSDFMAREIVGHESAAVSRQYTHLTTQDKRAAMQRMPDVTNH